MGEDRQDIWDAVVVGSGMSGMAAAAGLSKLGQKVLLLEQRQTLGGLTHSFSREGFTWDVGVPYAEHIVPTIARNGGEARSGARVAGLLFEGGTVVGVLTDAGAVMLELIDRACVIDQGSLIFEGSPEDMLHSPAVIENYLGSEDHGRDPSNCA